MSPSRPTRSALVLAVLLALVPGPALAEVQAPAAPLPVLERVEPAFLGLGWLFGRYEAAGPDWAGGPNTRTKLFRLGGDDRTVFRGLGGDNDFLDPFFPSLRVRANLRERVGLVPAALPDLNRYDRAASIADQWMYTGAGLYVAGPIMALTGLFWSVSGSGPNPTGAVLLLSGIATTGVGVAALLATPFLASDAFRYLDKSVATYNQQAPGGR